MCLVGSAAPPVDSGKGETGEATTCRRVVAVASIVPSLPPDSLARLSDTLKHDELTQARTQTI